MLTVYEEISEGLVPDFGSAYNSVAVDTAIRTSIWYMSESDIYFILKMYDPKNSLKDHVFIFYRINKKQSMLSKSKVMSMVEAHNSNILLGITDEEYNKLIVDSPI